LDGKREWVIITISYRLTFTFFASFGYHFARLCFFSSWGSAQFQNGGITTKQSFQQTPNKGNPISTVPSFRHPLLFFYHPWGFDKRPKKEKKNIKKRKIKLGGKTLCW